MAVNLDSILATPPARGEIEFSIFGPGFGECIAIHLGDEKWMVVDSCVRKQAEVPAVLEYFDRIGVEPEQAIELIVATHWHDDHVRGISRILEVASGATFCAASVFAGEEFKAIAEMPPTNSKFSSGVEELARVRRILNERSRPPELVSACKRIRFAPGGAVSEIWALSPSNSDALRGIDHIAALIGGRSPGVRRIPAVQPNDVSVVLHLETTAGPLLLGGDLEHHLNSRDRGWHAIVDDAGRPVSKAAAFKIPHHGSKNAHCPEVWEHLVSENPLCVVSPWERGKTPLPQPADIARMLSYTPYLYVTSDKRNVAVQRDRSVERTISESVRAFRPERLRTGHLQIRWNGSAWQVRGSEEAAHCS